MRKILVGLAMAGVGVVIALGAQNDFPEGSAGPDTAAVAAAVSDAGRTDGSGTAGAAARGVDAASSDGGAVRASVPGAQGAEAGEVPDGSTSSPGVAMTEHAQPPASSRAGSPADGAAGDGPAREAQPAAVAPAPPPAEPVPAGAAAAQEPDAAQVLRWAADAYASVRSLRADFVQRIENPILGNELTSRGTLYQRRPDRFLMRFSDPAGDVIVSDGRYFWVYYPSVDEKQVIRTRAARGGAGGVDLQAQFLGDPFERFTATLEGKGEVAGRAAYVLVLVPREPVGYRRLKVWVDGGDHLVRRFELTETDGRVRRFELSDLEVNIPLEDSLFRFTPPAGARVIDRG